MRSSNLPAEPGDFDLTPELEADLDRLAVAARDDPDARNALYERLRFKIERFTRAQRNVAPWLEPDELTSEAFLVLADLAIGWRGQHFGRYFLVAFPLRLHRTLRHTRHQPPGEPDEEPTADAERAPIERVVHDPRLELALRIIDLETVLTLEERLLLRRRLRDDASLPTLAARMGVSLRTLQRRWQTIVRIMRLSARLG